YNKNGHAEAYKDVLREDAIKVGSATKAPDYCFRIGGARKFFLEAKKPAVNIESDPAPAYQLRRYAWSADLPISILTDFEEFTVYDCRVRPRPSDKASMARILYLTYKEYAERWGEIASIFAKDEVLKGSFDRFVEAKKGKRGTSEVDKEFLAEIEKWRELLAKNIAIRNPKLSTRDLNYSVQKNIDRIIFLRMCEDRGVEPYGQLQALLNGQNTYGRLKDIYYVADQKYNSGLFQFRLESGRAEGPDELTPKLKIDDKVLQEIIQGLYYPESPYEFSVLGSEILGNIYEQFLGKVIRLTAGHQAKVEEKPEVRKAGGVYYTPTYIVDYIVKNTVGKLCEGKTPRQISSLRILDPACGSGSFLIGAYTYLLNHHRDWYLEDGPEKHRKEIYQGHGGQWYLTTAEKKRILVNNIYGVDIDSQAVEVTKLSLLLKVLEGENQDSLERQRKLFHERALPDLASNIKCGNSLVDLDFYKGQQMGLFGDEERYKINAFDWNSGFPEVFKSGGFNIVIGNPPYVKARDYDEDKEYYRDYLNNCGKFQALFKMWDLYIPFVEKGINILNEKGLFGMIIPDTIENSDYASLLREWLIANYQIYQIDFFPDSKIFKSQKKIVGIKNTIIFVCKEKSSKKSKRVFHDKNYEKIIKEEYVDNNAELFVQNALNININRNKTILLGDICFTSYGLRLNSDKADKKFTFKKADLLSEAKSTKNNRRFTEGKNLERYIIKEHSWVEWGTARCPERLVRPTFSEMYDPEKILLGRQTKVAALDLDHCIVDNTIIVCLLYYQLKGVDNKNIQKYFSNLPKQRSELEIISEPFGLYYLLGLLNSKLIGYYIKWLIQNGIDMFPDDWKKIPIPSIDFSNLNAKKRHDLIVDNVNKMIDMRKKIIKMKIPNEKTVLQRQIDATEKQIDQLVYELYGLTEEEIKIVENSKGDG
ncbi:MAG: N-6 DNA methylase, partial [Proteobacteria bacterium]|nr:N-6 DNA methylase [Pseudomonadota bacterium]